MDEINSSDSYKSISQPSTGIYKELGSKFLSFAYPVANEEEVKEIIATLRKEYHDARHHCFAYRIGSEGEHWRANDDGEPSSSAGKPILGQLLSFGVSDVLIVVVRYFGGTKLGVPGLIRAYRSAAADALSNADVVEKIAGREIGFTFEYLKMNDVMKLLRDFSAEILEQDFDNFCKIRIRVRRGNYERFIAEISELAVKNEQE
ncbi:MAG: YigZ family protein [Bacteroidetes bacterium 41-46]|nr:MAG: YigZ family protein [Bacteroidetes bacterium 41-46]